MPFEILPTALALNSLRSSGYRSAAHAVAELMDNAVDAGATRVELIGIERPEFTPLQQRRRVREIGVLDNGCGMDADTLRAALQIGAGSHLEPLNRRSIGRYGMGLPMASISQARRVDVWSWQNGPESALHTYLDLHEIQETKSAEVPEPFKEAPPAYFTNVARNADPKVPQTLGQTGTLVVWTDLDRYRGGASADTLFRQSRDLLGRIYRRPIASGKLAIRFVTVNDTHGYDYAAYVPANDPLYLSANPAFEAPWNAKPIFETWGRDSDAENFRLVAIKDARGREHTVTLRFSHAKEDARVGLPTNYNPGDTDYGKHAKKNTGVSLIRCGRELDLDTGFVSDHSPATERWWGVEVEFPPELDEVFGVTNDKQHAVHFSALTKSDLLERVNSREAARQKRAELYDDERSALFELCYVIKRGISLMRSALTLQTAGARSGATTTTNATNAANTTPAAVATDNGAMPAAPVVAPPTPPRPILSKDNNDAAARGAAGVGNGGARFGAAFPASQAASGSAGASPATPRAQHTTIARPQVWHAPLAGLDENALFAVKSASGPSGDTAGVTLNTNHPAYDLLCAALAPGDGAANTSLHSLAELRAELSQARDAVRLLISAWASLEAEAINPVKRERLQTTRAQWGEAARRLLIAPSDTDRDAAT